MKTTYYLLSVFFFITISIHAQQPIKKWLICGPFADDVSAIFEREYIPEKDVMPFEGMSSGGKEWFGYQSGAMDLIDFFQVFNTPSLTNQAVYACTYIISGQDQFLTLYFGSDDGAKIWVNDLLAWKINQQRGLTRYSEIIRVPLKKGPNRLLIKVTQEGGGWQFICAGDQSDIQLVNNIKENQPVPGSGYKDFWIPGINFLPGENGGLEVNIHAINNTNTKIDRIVYSLSNNQAEIQSNTAVSIADGITPSQMEIGRQDVLRLFHNDGAKITAKFQHKEIAYPLSDKDLFDCAMILCAGHQHKDVRDKAKAIGLVTEMYGFHGDLLDAIQPLLTSLANNDNENMMNNLKNLEEQIMENAPDRSNESIHVVGHAHIDMNWLWPWPETKKIMHDNLRQVVAFMHEFDDFTMLQSQAAIYQEIEKIDPVLFSEMKRFVSEGRLEPVGGMWTEGDCNLSHGEAIARSFLLGQSFFESRFGKPVRVGWLPDNFGHPSQLPQILKLSGIDYYYFHRCRPHLGTFWWKGPDGSKVLCYSNFTYNGKADMQLLKEIDNVMPDKKRILAVTGVGDHGGGPTRQDIDNVHAFAQIEKMPDIRFTTAENFYQASEKEMDGRPSHKGEMQFVFEGCYTSIAEIKEGNRKSENSLYQAEFLSSIQWLNGKKYPAEDLRNCWQKLCFNQFHDILPGSGIYETCKDAEADYKYIINGANDILDKAFRDFTDGIRFNEGIGQPVVAFNMHPFKKDNLVVAEFYSHEKPVTVEANHWGHYYNSEIIKPVDVGQGQAASILLKDGNGKSYTGQIIWCKEFPPGYRSKVLFQSNEIPAGGYKTFYVDPTKPGADNELMKHKDFQFETAFYIVEFDQKTGDIKRLFDKSQQFEYIKPGEKARLIMKLEKPHGMSAWNIGETERIEELSDVPEVAFVEEGPVRACIQSTKKWGNSKIIQRVYLYKSYPRIDFDLNIHWFEKGSDQTLSPFLQAAFPLNIQNGEFHCHVPFDVVKRPTNGQEVPAHYFVDVSDGEKGIALINSSKYGHALHNNLLTLSLMRASYDPNIYPNQGMFRVHFALIPHEGDWTNGVLQEGEIFNKAIYATEPPSLSSKSVPENRPGEDSFFVVEQSNVSLTGIKQSEEGNELVLRLCEMEGKETLANIYIPVQIKSVRCLNLLEKELDTENKAGFNENRIEVKMKAHEVVTLGIAW